MTADNLNNASHYDAALALHLADDDPEIRDKIVYGTLQLFSDGGSLATLFDTSYYRSNPDHSRALTHRAITLAQQGAMPSLESLCIRLNTALKLGEKSGTFTIAEEIGRDLPATIESVWTAVLSESRRLPLPHDSSP